MHIHVIVDMGLESGSSIQLLTFLRLTTTLRIIIIMIINNAPISSFLLQQAPLAALYSNPSIKIQAAAQASILMCNYPEKI